MNKKMLAIILFFIFIIPLNSYASNGYYINTFYAINSYDQFNYCDLDNSLEDINSVSFGWSRIQYDEKTDNIKINITTDNKNDFYIPCDYEEPLVKLNNKHISYLLNVFSDKYFDKIFQNRSKVINDMISLIKTYNFNGIVIDFENLCKEDSKEYIAFLEMLNNKLDIENKLLYVTVPPQTKDNLVYDYSQIEEVADKIILMAHDYEAKYIQHSDYETQFINTPLAPIDKLEESLKTITDKSNGVKDLNKILLQINFGTVQWKINDSKLISSIPNDKLKIYPFRPTYQQLYNRINKELVKGRQINEICQYDEELASPYLKYYNEEDKTDNIIWYEDARSVKEKIELIKKYHIGGLSIWRFGIIPQFKSEIGIKSFLNVLDYIN